VSARRGALATCALAALAAGCAVNPATGKRQLSLIGERDEIAIGREHDRTVAAEMGLVDDEPLQGYVAALGGRLAAVSERPALEWTFRVVDDPVVNAFALPGGYVYVTRGILAHLRSEAELATVVGHEIGHVTARHSVNQMSKAQLAQLGLGIGAILAPEQAESVGSLAGAGLGLLMLKYGRDDERQADELGLRYLVAAGLDPRPAPDVFDMLARVGAAAGGERLPSWASSHPAPENRRQQMEARIAALGPRSTPGGVDDEAYLRRIDGLVFGEDPRQGLFEGDRFVHPEMAFQLEFPAGWRRQNQHAAVVAVSPGADATILLTLAAEKSAAEALERFFAGEGVRRTGEPMQSIHGLPTAGGGFGAGSGTGAVAGRVGFVELGGRVLRLMGYAAEASWTGHETTIRRALASFDRLTDARLLAIEPARLRIVRAERTMTLEEFAAAHAATAPVETLALINRLDPGESVRKGRAYKVVAGGEPQKPRG